MPTAIVEQALRLVILILEGIPPEQRQAQAIAWFYLWWPVAKLFLKKEQEQQIEAIMATIKPPAQS